jgi:stress-induced morphogen
MSISFANFIKDLSERLKHEFPDSFVAVKNSGAATDKVRIVVISHAFDDLTEPEKQEKVWSVVRSFGEEATRILRITPYSPDEL